MNGCTSHVPWVEKYRPRELGDIVGHDMLMGTLQLMLRQSSASRQNALPHMFLYGPPGTGKTSTILACARKIYGAYTRVMVLHLNASDDRGISALNRQIVQFASTNNIFFRNQVRKMDI